MRALDVKMRQMATRAMIKSLSMRRLGGANSLKKPKIPTSMEIRPAGILKNVVRMAIPNQPPSLRLSRDYAFDAATIVILYKIARALPGQSRPRNSRRRRLESGYGNPLIWQNPRLPTNTDKDGGACRYPFPAEGQRSGESVSDSARWRGIQNVGGIAPSTCARSSGYGEWTFRSRVLGGSWSV